MSSLRKVHFTLFTVTLMLAGLSLDASAGKKQKKKAGTTYRAAKELCLKEDPQLSGRALKTCIKKHRATAAKELKKKTPS